MNDRRCSRMTIIRFAKKTPAPSRCRSSYWTPPIDVATSDRRRSTGARFFPDAAEAKLVGHDETQTDRETRRRASKQTRRAPAGRPLLWSVGHACWLTVPAGLTQRCCCGCWGLQVCISIICAGRPLQFHSLRPFDREFHAHNARCPPLWAAVLFPSPFVCLLVSITKITRQNPVTGN